MVPKKDTQVLEKLFFQMSQEQELQFLSAVFQSMNTYFIPDLPAVAGVGYDKKLKLFKLMINPKEFAELKDDKERVSILIHEIYHILHKHVFIPEEIIIARSKPRMNVALDLAINQHIKNLPEFACTIDKFRDKSKKLFPKNQTWEQYYDLLEQAEVKLPQDAQGQGQPGQPGEQDGEGEEGDQQAEGQSSGSGQPSGQKGKGKGKEKGQGQGQQEQLPGQGSGGNQGENWQPVNFDQQGMDEHGWGDSDQKDRLESTRDLIKRSMQKSSFTHSSVPQFITDCLAEVEKQINKLDYKALLLRALKNSLPSKDIEKTWKRPSRRYGDIAKGNQMGKMPKLAVFIDTSGSISHEEANEFLRITNNFMITGVSKATLHMFHTSIYYKERVKKNFKVERTSFQSGGTDLQEAMDVIAKDKPDLSIILTDGYYDRPNLSRRMNKHSAIVFIISKGGNVKHPMHDLGVTVPYESK